MKNLYHMNISSSYCFLRYNKACSTLATLLANYFLEVKQEHQPEQTSYTGNVLSNNGTFKDKSSPLIHQIRGTREEMSVYGTKEKHESLQLPGVKKQMKIQKKSKRQAISQQHLRNILVSFSGSGGSRLQRTVFKLVDGIILAHVSWFEGLDYV